MVSKPIHLPSLIIILSLLLQISGSNSNSVGIVSAASGTTERVSVTSDGSQGYGSFTGNGSISDDGRFVAFMTSDSLVVEDTNGFEDVYVHDRQTGITERVSVASDGSQANNWSYLPSISADGRFVAFTSLASNLVSGDTNGAWDIFVHDRLSGSTERVTVDSNGSQGNTNFSEYSAISADGRYIAFVSDASNLVSGDTNGHSDAFVHDCQTGITERVSVASNGSQANYGTGQSIISISGDGRFVTFDSPSTNLVAGDTNGEFDVFVHDRQTGITERVSVASNGTQSNNYSDESAISGDGRYVTFASYATNLVVGDTNGVKDAFIHDRQTGITERVSVASDGSQPNDSSSLWSSSVSFDGRYVTFTSSASNLVTEDTNQTGDVFVHDRQTGITERVSVASDGSQANNHSYSYAISAYGRYIVFISDASNLVDDDTNGQTDVFVRDREVFTPTYSISGLIKDTIGNPISGVTISDGGYHSTTSGVDGTYTLSGLYPGNYTLTSALQGYYFDDPSIAVTIQTADIPNLNFSGGLLKSLPIIFLPGILGSRLYNDPVCPLRIPGEIWLDTSLITNPFSSSLFWNTLSLDTNILSKLNNRENPARNPCDQIYPKNIMDDSSIKDVYSPFINSVKSEGWSIQAFPYDWRLSLEYSSDKLLGYINGKQYKKVILIGHSMGGLLARQFISDKNRVHKVAMVITVGTPYLGAAKTALTIRAGLLPGDLHVDNLYLASPGVAELGRYSPGLMELLPSSTYFKFFSEGYYINNNTTLDTFSKTESFFITNTGKYGSQIQDLLQFGNNFHENNDDLSKNLNQVDYYLLAAAYFITPHQIREYPCANFLLPDTCFDVRTYLIGDNTVPTASALDEGLGGSATHLVPFYVSDFLDPKEMLGHGDLMKVANIITAIKNIILGKPPKSGLLSSQKATDQFSYFQLVINGSGIINVQDNYNRDLTQDATGNLTNEIPGATLDQLPNETIVMLPTNLTYKFSYKETGNIPLQIKISDLQAPLPEQVFSANESAIFIDIPSTPGGNLSINLDKSSGFNTIQLSIDLNGDGIPDQIITPSSTLDSQQSQDITMPDTTISLQGNRYWNKFYTGQVSVTISASDNETGIYKTEYSLNKGETWQTYQHPFTLIAEQIPLVYARSTDKAGNFEYPWISQRLQPYKVNLPLLTK